MKIAVVGAGISGVAAARTLQRAGHDVVVYEASAAVGGVWTLTYPGVRLQNVAEHYRLGEFPWPFTPDTHPTAIQILRYLEAAVRHFEIDVRLSHRVLGMHELADGWQLDIVGPAGAESQRFDWVVVAIGQYAQDPLPANWPGQDRFAGRVLGDRQVRDLGMLAGKQVVVVGFGKSAVDMAAFAAERGSKVHHVFRAARWLLPPEMFGVRSSKLLFSRLSTAFIPSWVHPSVPERVLHTHMKPLVRSFWSMVSGLIHLYSGTHSMWSDPVVRARMKRLIPDESLTYHMRSAIAIAPDQYFPLVAKGRIEPVRGDIAGLDERGVILTDGRRIACDMVVASLGCPSPRFPFMPAKYREMLESEPDGVQLYRHLLHPRVPRVAFAGFNHGFLHVPSVEIAMLWLSAHLRGDLMLPPVETMEHCITAVRDWKRAHMLFEPSRSCAINTRFHQHLDVLLGDLGLRPYRKQNPLAEVFEAYTVEDYAAVFDEYEQARIGRSPRVPLPDIN